MRGTKKYRGGRLTIERALLPDGSRRTVRFTNKGRAFVRPKNKHIHGAVQYVPGDILFRPSGVSEA